MLPVTCSSVLASQQRGEGAAQIDTRATPTALAAALCSDTRARSSRRYVNDAESGDGVTEDASHKVLQKARSVRMYLLLCLKEDNKWLEAERADEVGSFKTKRQISNIVGELMGISGSTVYRSALEFLRLWAVGNETGVWR